MANEESGVSAASPKEDARGRQQNEGQTERQTAVYEILTLTMHQSISPRALVCFA
jgi:hypothetical protein